MHAVIWPRQTERSMVQGRGMRHMCQKGKEAMCWGKRLEKPFGVGFEKRSDLIKLML